MLKFCCLVNLASAAANFGFGSWWVACINLAAGVFFGFLDATVKEPRR